MCTDNVVNLSGVIDLRFEFQQRERNLWLVNAIGGSPTSVQR
jgi:hypothetical protein